MCFVFDPASVHIPKTKHTKLLPQADERRCDDEAVVVKAHCMSLGHIVAMHEVTNVLIMPIAHQRPNEASCPITTRGDEGCSLHEAAYDSWSQENAAHLLYFHSSLGQHVGSAQAWKSPTEISNLDTDEGSD